MSQVSEESKAVGVKDGRPSEFKEEYIAKADEFLELCKDEEFTFHKTDGVKSDSYERHIKVKLPTIQGFALFLDVSIPTLHNWAKENQEFFNALEKIKRVQHERLISGGLSNDYNSTIAKLMLSSNHGYKEKSDVTSGDEPIKGVVVLPEKENRE